MSEWVTVRIFPSRVAAEIAKGFLAEHQIEAMVRADDMGGMWPELALTKGVKLQVAKDNLERARELLPPE